MGNNSGMAITALVFGIAGIIIPFIGFLCAIAAIILGFIAINKIKLDPNLQGRGLAIAGVVLGFVGLLVGILTIIGAIAYFGVLSPQKFLPERTTWQAPLPNVDVAVISAADNSITVAFRNNKGTAIKIPMTTQVTSAQCNNPTLSGTMNGNPITPTTDISNGDGFNLKWSCAPGNTAVGKELNADICFDYINSETGLTQKSCGSVYGKYS